VVGEAADKTLEKAGGPQDSLSIHEMGAFDAGAAFMAGKRDAAASREPWLSRAAGREGGHPAGRLDSHHVPAPRTHHQIHHRGHPAPARPSDPSPGGKYQFPQQVSPQFARTPGRLPSSSIGISKALMV